jgi:nucleoid-associated protein YgaU
VKKGDTLWDICDGYFGNPWQWPRVWSYNPDILNPHWIFPGDVVRLRAPGPAPEAVATTPAAGAPEGAFAARMEAAYDAIAALAARLAEGQR